MRVITTIPQNDLNQVGACAREIENHGYHGIVTLENQHDPFLPLAVAATHTEKISLETGVAIAFLRSPMSVANISWDLNEASKGRFVLGLGPQIKAHNEKRFSVPWSAPAPRLREYVQSLRAIWRCWKFGEKLNYQGEHYQFSLMIPNFVPEGSGIPLPPVTLAAVGPTMLKLSAEVGDGVKLHPFCTQRYFDQVVSPALEKGFSKSAKDRENFEISGGGFIATGADDDAVQKMVEWVRYRVAFYGSTPAYWPVLEAHDRGDLGRKLNQMTKAGQWDQIAAEIDDDLLGEFAAIGRHENIANAIEKRFKSMTDVVHASTNLNIRSDWPPDLIQDIEKIPTAFDHFNTD
ncbi:MAG: TIGR03617 family F420-dependent LLM class oxidoreductase [Gammaproteobacteria bacterium]